MGGDNSNYAEAMGGLLGRRAARFAAGIRLLRLRRYDACGYGAAQVLTEI